MSRPDPLESRTFALTMTIHTASPLNANGVPLPPPEAQVLKNGLPSTLPDIDVCPVSLSRDDAYHH